MAGIDKAYAKTWEQYKEIYDFLSSYKEQVQDEYGNKFWPLDFLADYTEEEFRRIEEYQRRKYLDYYKDPENYKRDKEWFAEIGEPEWEPDVERAVEVMIFNNPTFFDVWLIRNCKIEFIQARLREQYRSSYDAILNRTSEFDTTTYRRSHKFKVTLESNLQIKDSGIWWWIQVDDVPKGSGMSFGYNEETGMWYDFSECREFTTNTFSFHGNLGERKLGRLMKKWNLPVGVVLSARGMWRGYCVKSWKIRVK